MITICFFIRDIAQLGRAPALGAGGRRFKSYYPDLNFNTIGQFFLLYILIIS